MTPSNDSTDFSVDEFSEQQQSLRRYGKLHWVHWWIIGLSVVMTFLGWRLSESLLYKNQVNRFEIEAQRVVDKMSVRMAHYEDALVTGVATLSSHDHDMSRAQWKTYAESLELTRRYPGVNGIGLIREVAPDELAAFELEQQSSWPGFKAYPEHTMPVHLPIVYIEPERENAAAVGLDVAFETNRRTAVLLARDTKTTQISGPIELVQDDGKTPGFLFLAPYFDDNEQFKGLVYAPLVVRKLVDGVLGNQYDQIEFSIIDGTDVLYDERDDANNPQRNARHSIEIDADFYGRQWTFLINSAPGFSAGSVLTQSTVVLICGLAIEAMLLVLFLLLTRSNKRVLNHAEAMTATLGQQTRVLADKNSDLENFAHIVSHDLKTPIRAIQNLTQFIEEDLEDVSAPDNIKELVANHVVRVNEQAERGHALIKGVLNYSLVGYETDTIESVKTAQLLEHIGTSLGLSSQQLNIKSNMPVLQTYSVRLTQVFENLIGNACKYHPSPDQVRIVVSVKRCAGFYRFSVADNGNGIDPQFHERVFKPFTMLQPHADQNSSGIGLSIVKKTVEAMGGSVGIVADKAIGTEFYFDWPITHDQNTKELRRAA